MTPASHITNPVVAVHYPQEVRAVNVQCMDMGCHIKYANNIASLAHFLTSDFRQTCVRTGKAGNLEILTARDNGMHRDGVRQKV